MANANAISLQPYPSLEAMRKANDELLSKLPDDDSGRLKDDDVKSGKELNASFRTEIEAFIRRGIDTGTLLDTLTDRRAAQALIDYWVASSYSAGDANARRSSANLKPFDAETMGLAAERGEAVIAALDPNDQKLARQILLRLFRLPDGATTVVSLPSDLHNLAGNSGAERTVRIIDSLAQAGILNRVHTDWDDIVELRYDALARRWKRLREWIDERVKFRDTAQYWANTGKNRGALVSSELSDDAESYGNLNNLEQAFVAASRDNSRKLVWYRIAAAIIAVVVIGALPLFQYTYATFYVPWMVDRKINIVKSDGATEKRIEALRQLAEYQKNQPIEIDLSSIHLKGENPNGLDLGGLSARNLLLTYSTLQNINFQDAKLPSSIFIRSIIFGSNLERASLDFARFDSSFIDSSSFSNANLFRAVFNGAQLCRVNFSDAIVRYASFWDVTFEADNPPNFHNSAWWLATGWNKDQRKILTTKFSNEDLKGSESIKQELNLVDENLDQASNSVVRAKALNDKAWTLATLGIDLDNAERAVTEALKIYSTVGQSILSPRDVGNAEGTLGYILIQKLRLPEAQKFLSNAMRDRDDDASIYFHYALTLWIQGNVGEARIHLTKAIARGYSPSHELYLLRDQIPSDLEEAIEAASDNRQRTSPKRPCPPS
jgi:uncharacterized protein YjbI with pentapeptide repeats